MDSSSYTKGEEFEDYIQNVIFPKGNYDLIHRTHNFKQNSQRFPEESKNPDFKFRCKITKLEFYVEAKFRSRFNDDNKLHILDIGQFNRYKELNKPDSPVFIAIGYEGTASDPKAISLIRIDKIEYLDLFRKVLEKHGIDKRPYGNDSLVEKANEKFASKELKIVILPDAPSHDERGRKQNKTKYLYYITLIAILITLFFVWFYSSQSLLESKPTDPKQEASAGAEQSIRENISKYYLAFENNDVETLGYFISNKVDRWYSKSNVSLKSIKAEAKVYLAKYPYRDIRIQWDTFKYIELPNGDASVSYNLIYRIKSNVESDFRRYDLRIKSIWGRDGKIRSMYEEKLN